MWGILEHPLEVAPAPLQVKVVSQFIHTTPKWFCAGGNNGIIIATNQYNNIDLDLQSMTATIDSGVMVRHKDFVFQ